MKTPILGSTYVARSVNAAANRMVNLFPEIISEGGKEPAFLNRAPGLRLLGKVGDGPIRGMHEVGGNLYVVSGQEIYKMLPGPVVTTTPGSWAESPDNCGIASVSNITGSGTITLTVTDDYKYQFTVGTETWPATPSDWDTIVAGSPHAFSIATITFDAEAPVSAFVGVWSLVPNADGHDLVFNDPWTEAVHGNTIPTWNGPVARCDLESPLADFIIAVPVLWDSSPANSLGWLNFRVHAADDSVISKVMLSDVQQSFDDGQFNLYNGESEHVGSSYHQGPHENVFKVRRTGDKLEFFLDDTLVATKVSGASTAGAAYITVDFLRYTGAPVLTMKIGNPVVI